MISAAVIAAGMLASCSNKEIVDERKHSINSPFHSKNVILLL